MKRATLDPEWDETLELSVYDKDILDADEAEELAARLVAELREGAGLRDRVLAPTRPLVGVVGAGGAGVRRLLGARGDDAE